MRAALPVLATLGGMLFAALAIAAEQGEPLPFSPPVRTADACISEFGPFGGFCTTLAGREDYSKVYGRPFWNGAAVRAAHADLDADGLEDIVFMVQHTGDCGSHGCRYMFAFGGQPVPEVGGAFGINARHDPALVDRRGEPGIVFGPDGAFISISSIKQSALDAFEHWARICTARDC